ncbi:MAG: M36 family metallopeptidase [Planctomycetota bacterium]|nr:M36 family metallopeptidase [Planctomycetota bacterium]
MFLQHWLARFSNASFGSKLSGRRKAPARRIKRTAGGLGSFTACQIESLESRVLLAAPDPTQDSKALGAGVGVTTTGQSKSASFPAQTDGYMSGGFLSGPSTDAPVDIAKRFLVDHASEFGYLNADVASFHVTGVTTSKASGLTHVYLRQQLNGIDVDGGDANVSVMSDGRVLTAGSRLFPSLAARATSVRNINAQQAILAAATFVGIASPRVGALEQNLGGISESQVYAGGNVSQGEIPVQLVYQMNSDGGLHLSWNLNLQVPGSQDWFDMNVDAGTGSVLRQDNWTEYENYGSTSTVGGSSAGSGTAGTAGTGGAGSSLSGSGTTGSGATGSGSGSSFGAAAASGVPNTGSYNVWAIPTEAPNDGNRTLVVDPADPIASPFGWHDTNGALGAESTLTTGNNVSAQEDTDANNTGGAQPDGGSGLVFDFAFDPTKSPANNQSAAITQLFYMNNIAHDIHYQYGFDEASGNFQVNNYGRGGLGNDAVQADAQDGSGTNNANFGTPPDGQKPRMQQFIFTLTNPNRDSDMDNGVIIHEYGHGVSNRLTGGPANANALNAIQSGGMGEGWSDFWALMFLQRASDTQNAGYGVGTYVLGQPITGPGIRQYPYSFNMAINPHTYADYNASQEVHDAGEIWTSVLWDLNWLLIAKNGFSSDLYAGTAGNNLTLQLVMDGLKLQPANPSFLDGRDAILAADEALTGGENAGEIWTAFARRGMGFSAYDGGSANATAVTAAFDLPSGPTGTVTFDKTYYTVGGTVKIEVKDSDLNGQPSINVAVASSGGDTETVTLTARGAGIFRGTITTAGGVGANDGTLNVAPGDLITVTYQDAKTGANTPATVTDTATIALDNVLYIADFNDDLGNASLDGFTINNTGAANAGQWHQSLGRGNQPGHSSDDSLYYGSGEGPTGGGLYGSNTAGRAVSPTVHIPSTGPTELRFNYFLDAEAIFDIGRLIVSSPGQADVSLGTSERELTNPTTGWKSASFDLSQFRGQDVQFKFDFAADSQNVREGWYIDDVAVVNLIVDFGKIAGVVYNDLDSSGGRNPGEPGRPNWRVYLDGNGNGVYDNNLQTTTVSSNNVPLAIADNSTVFSTLTVSGLITEIELTTDNGGSDNNYIGTIFDDSAPTSITTGIAPFNGRFRPESPLSVLNGTNPNGVWTLRITDDVAVDSGTLTSWSLEITTGFNDVSVLTDSQGAYAFSNIPGGAYLVRDVQQPLFTRTEPLSGLYSVNLAQNQVRNGLNFGYKDPNFPPVFTSPASVNVPENTTVVTTVTAVDPTLPPQTVTFSITGGVDRALFSITSGGALRFVNAPDFEIPGDANTDNTYLVQITADDGAGGRTTQNMTVNVTPVNDNSPVFITTSAPSLPENTTAVLTVAATDADRPTQTITYSITGGVDQAKFSLTGSTLAFRTAPDYENPTDADRNNIYLVQITASDGLGRTTVQDLTVIVTDADGQLSGIVFNDINANQIQDPGETGRAGATVILATLKTTTVAATAVPIPIPDLTTVTSNLNVSGLGTVVDVNVVIDIDHTFDSDLDIYLTGPDGTQFELSTDNGAAGNSYHQTVFDDQAATSIVNGVAPFAGSFRPEGSLASLVGTSANGLWTLRVTDDSEKDIGILKAWSLQITTLVSEESRLTNDQGVYNFNNLPVASFVIREVVPRGVEQTVPATGYYALSLGVNEVQGGLHFGNKAPGFPPVITSTATPTIPENTTAVLNLTATDADLPAQTITYSILDGADQAKFTITPSGALSFISPPDFEIPGDANGDNVYLVQIAADDGNGYTTIQDLTVTVTGVNDNVPVFTTATTASVVENTTAVTTVAATDADRPNQTITYSLTGGADRARFSINGAGALSFSAAPDYENPTDSDRNNVYLVQVTASDGHGGTTTQDLNVTVTDGDGVLSGTVFNDRNGDGIQEQGDDPRSNWVVFLDQNNNGLFDQNVPTTTTFNSNNVIPIPDVSTITSTLTLSGLGSITDVNVQLDISHTFDADLDVFLISPTGVEIELTTDNGGSSNHYTGTIFDDGAVTSITAGSAPFLGTYRPESPLAVLNGTSANGVWTLRVTDDSPNDMGSLNSWSLEISTLETEVSRTTDSQGRYRFDNLPVGNFVVHDVLQPGYERTTPSTGLYNVSLAVNQVRDTLNFGNRPAGFAPVFTSTATPSVAENTQSVLTVTATEPSRPGQPITFSITGGEDAARFSITSGGALSFAANPDFEIPADLNHDNVYLVQVTADDGMGGTTAQNLTVTVTAVNDNSPIFTTATSANVAENTTTVLTVNATDADLPAQTVTYSISGGADRTKFSITGGVLSFVSAPDYENPTDSNRDNVYLVQVTANDNAGRTTNQFLSITVTPTNDNSPIFTSPQTFSVAENVKAVGTVTATDADRPVQTVTFAISGGADQSKFSITTGGVLSFVSEPDYENPTDVDHNNAYLVQITASDGAGGTTIQNLTVNVTPVNEFDPVFTTSSAVSIPENTIPVLSVGASDADLPAQTVTYSIVGGDDQSKFTITSGGALSFLAAPDFERPTDLNQNNIYLVRVRASDGLGRSATQDLAVTVTNVAESDIRVLSAKTDGSVTLTVNYEIANAISAPFTLGIFQSADDLPGGDVSLYSLALSASADLSVGTHTKTLTIGTTTGLVKLPGAGLTDPTDDYFLLAVADPANVLFEDGFNDNNTAVVTGAYHLSSGLLMVQGTAGSDIFTASDPSNFVFNAAVLAYTSGTVTGLRIRTHAGADTVNISAFDKATSVFGGAGNDSLTGGTNADSLFGGGDDDVLTGNGGSDILAGEAGNDQMIGGAGNDTYLFAADTALGSDVLDETGGGTDTLDFSSTLGQAVSVDLGQSAAQIVNAYLTLTLGSATTLEYLIGGVQGDTLKGNSLANSITGGPGNDQLAGGTGNDSYLFDTDSALGTDTLTELSGEGTDTLIFSSTTTVGIAVDLSRTTTQVVNSNLSLTLSSNSVFENVIGGSLNDTLTGNGLTNTLTGGPGNDVLAGGAGDDIYPFDADIQQGSDTISDGAGSGIDLVDFTSTTTKSVTLNLGLTTAQVVNSNLTLTLSAGSEIENVTGGSLNDVLTGNGLANALTGGPGDDTLSGGAGSDSLLGGAGNDSLTGGDDDDVYLMDADTALGTDTLIEAATTAGGIDLLDFSGTSSVGVTLNLALTTTQVVNANLSLALSSASAFEMVLGTSKDDTISGNSANNVLFGGAGMDTLMGLGGRDLLFGGSGADTLDGGDDEDIVIGGTTTYYNESSRILDRTAIRGILSEWARGDLLYSARVNNLRNGGGLNGTFKLTNLTLLNDSSAADTLTGGNALDWFWKYTGDVVIDLNNGGTETVN